MADKQAGRPEGGNGGGIGGGMGRGAKLLLVLSLALNLLVIGVVAGGAFKHARNAGAAPPGSDLRALWWALPDAARRDLRATMSADHEPGHRARNREERRAQAAERMVQMHHLLRAEPFDAEAFAALLELERQARAGRIDAAHAALVARVAQMSSEERAAMAERLETRRQRRFTRD